MVDPLRKQIEEALKRPLPGDTFERCAVRLLREFHPSLIPVMGGNDAGLDGSGIDAFGPFGLIATTSSEPLRNLNRNLSSYAAAGGVIKRFILATPRVLTGRRRVNLETAAARVGFELVQIYDGASLAELLYRDAESRKELLGIDAGVSALTAYPLTRRPDPLTELKSRDELLTTLEVTDSDVLIVGKPGVGKTAILAELAKRGWGLFDNGAERGALANAIRETQPVRIIVEDAHFARERLVELRAIRVMTGLSFSIVASSWPGSQAEVGLELPHSELIVVPELTRDEILSLIVSLGIHGPRELQREIVNQSLGRPGLAATLAAAALSGRTHAVYTGDFLWDDTSAWYGRALGETALHLLAAIALAGYSGITAEQCAQLLGSTPLGINKELRGLASGGVVDEVFRFGVRTRYLRVQPASLRYAVVKQYFGSTGAASWSSVARHFDSPSQALGSLVGARLRGAEFQTSDLAELLSPDADADTARAFAALGEAETRIALARVPARRWDIASEALWVAPRVALRELMSLAEGDERPRHSHPDHPIRVIAEHLRDPRTSIEIRREAIELAAQWLVEEGDSAVALEVMCAALHPAMHQTYSDPGAGDTITIAERIYEPGRLTQIEQLWGKVLEVLAHRRFTNYGPFLRALRDWVHPDIAQLGGVVDPASRAITDRVAEAVIRQSASIFANTPAVLAELRAIGKKFGLELSPSLEPTDYDILYPQEDWSGDFKDWERRVEGAVDEFAKTLRKNSNVQIAERIASVEHDAQVGTRSWPRLTPRLCEQLATLVADPMGLLQELDRLGVSGDLIRPFLIRIVRDRVSGWSDVVRACFLQERTEFVAVDVCLTESVDAELQDEALRRLHAGYQRLIEFHIIRGEFTEAVLSKLFEHEDGAVAKAAAVALHDEEKLAKLSSEARARWRRAIVRSTADHQDYWLWIVLQREPDLLRDWVSAWLTRNTSTYVDHLDEQALAAIRALPRADRSALLSSISSEHYRFLLGELIQALVNDDEALLGLVFEADELKDYARSVLAGEPNETWMTKALIALSKGMTAKDVVASCISGAHVWSGSESAHWSSFAQSFAKLRGGTQQREAIKQAGIHLYEGLARDSAEREHREAVFGFDRGGG